MTMSLDAAAQVMREAMREKVKRHSFWYLVQSGLMIVAGILALVYPVVSSFAAVFALGCLLIISGIAQGISLIDAREVPHFWLQLVSVVLSVIVGVLLIRHRGAGLLALTLLLLVYFMVEGISKVIFSLTIRPFPNWGWVLVSGIVGILLSLYLLASFPVTAICCLAYCSAFSSFAKELLLDIWPGRCVQVDTCLHPNGESPMVGRTRSSDYGLGFHPADRASGAITVTDKERLLSLSVYWRARFRTDGLPPHPEQARRNVGRWPRFSRRLCRISDPLSPMLTIKQGSNRCWYKPADRCIHLAVAKTRLLIGVKPVRYDQVELVLRPRHRHVQQPPFLFDLFPARGRHIGRNTAINHVQDADDPPFLTFGRMDR
jgi:uncharacterized membrane protein HdeD (DUF308 family)